MTATHEDQLKAMLDGVERDENGVVVLSPYGFKTQVINGKKYIVSLTKEEYMEIATKNGTEIIPSLGSCMSAPGYCIQHECERYCSGRWSSNSYVCTCSYA
ncbi:MAG: hypothetical protein K2Y29_13165 [Beijerinckiaceae bacterium]|nr:hypothetical protein [Beijerinckiaceae bacterium]